MPYRFFAHTALPVRWPFPLGTLTRDIRIVETPIFNEDNWRSWNLRASEERQLERPHWLAIETECELHEKDEAITRMAGMLRTGMLGLQLWAPKGWDGLIIASEASRRIQNVFIQEAFPDSRWGRMMDAEKLDPTVLARVVEGALQAFESGSVPVINPFQFLEIGLQTAFNHRRAGALLWITGLDGLLAAEKRDVFVARLTGLLGTEAAVFPPDWVGREPVYTVGQVAGRIFEWRGLIAHGKKILDKFRERIPFEFKPNELQYLPIEDWTEETLLHESALFCLIAALRKVIEEGLTTLVQDKRAWEAWLDSRETGVLSRPHGQTSESSTTEPESNGMEPTIDEDASR